jgi:methyl-accepting chemotaxis protein
MRTLRMTILLGLAGLAWKYVKPRLPAARAQMAKARERIEPALRDATTKVRSASKDAAESVRDVSLSTAETADALVEATSGTQHGHATSERG